MTQRGCTRSSRERDVISRSTKWNHAGWKNDENFHLRRLQIHCEMMCASTIQNRKTRSSMRSSESRDIQSVSTVIIDIDSQNWQKPEAAPTGRWAWNWLKEIIHDHVKNVWFLSFMTVIVVDVDGARPIHKTCVFKLTSRWSSGRMK